jgi:hypothetical protein
MGDDILLVRPGKVDINGQFTAGAQIRRTRRIYDRIKDRSSGQYNFGELTAFFYNYSEDQDDAWQDEINNNYPSPVIDKIRAQVISVLEKVDPKDTKCPISLTFYWDPKPGPNGGPDAVLTQAGDAYTITIYQLMEPAKTSFVERQKPKSN